ncbi:MAG: hypothetical protein COB85_07230, partial [Bacteroidetes bacterium]
MFNKMLINPSYTGGTDKLKTSIGYRQQHVGLSGAPNTQFITIHAPIIKKKMGLGLKLVHENVGVTNQNSLVAAYAYHISLSKAKLSFGLEGGIFNQSIDFSNLITTSPDDNALPKNKASVIIPDVSFGVYYHSEKFYFGAAAYHLLQNKMNFSGYSESDRLVVGQLSSHVYVTTGLTLTAGDNIKLEPSLLLRYAVG